MKKILAFTLIETLIVIAITALLLSVSSVVYTQVSKQSRDARRKVDLEQLRGALEQYRANNNFYPDSTGNWQALLTNAATTYIQSIPSDPKGGSYTYVSKPNLCDNTNTYCNSYTLTATLEIPANTPYVVTPYGVVPAP